MNEQERTEKERNGTNIDKSKEKRGSEERQNDFKTSNQAKNKKRGIYRNFNQKEKRKGG